MLTLATELQTQATTGSIRLKFEVEIAGHIVDKL
jgi:hypothetical protein